MDNSKIYNFLNNNYSTSTSDPFWVNKAPNFVGWNKSYPFKLMFKIYQETEDGKGSYITPTTGKDLTVIEFVLPIPPQDLNISMPFANVLQPTLGGIVEQTSGAPFREIVLSGVTGVNIIKNSAHSNSVINDIALYGGSVLGSTLNQTENFLFNARNIVGSQSKVDGRGILNNPYGTSPTDETSVYFKSTGFYQIEALKSFLEKYAELKKFGRNLDGFHSKNLRLVFANYKDGSFYAVSGVNFIIRRSANDPLMYNYTITLRAFRRVSPDALESSMSIPKIKFTKNYFVNSVFKLNSALEILENVSQGISALTGDVGNGIRRIGQSANILLKNGGGIALALKDFPDSAQKNIIDTASKIPGNIGNQFNSLMNKINSYSGSDTNTSSKSSSLTGNPLYDKSQLQDRLITDFYLSKDVQASLRNFIDQNSKKTKTDFDNDRDSLITYASNLANISGANTQTYLNTYNQGTASAPASLDQPTAEALFALNEMVQQFDGLSARSIRNSEVLPTSLEYIAGLATESGIAFRQPVSKFAVPFPYGSSLERLALQYLGDANRWHEIAALNGLASPFIDETGWKKSLTTNGNGDKVYVSEIENVYLNQTVYLVSNKVPRTKCRVLGIVKVGNNYQITLNKSSLDNFKVTDFATLEGFLPNTVNSQQVVYIPSDVSIPEVGVFNNIPGVNQYDPLIQAAGADLLLDDNGDLIVTKDGDTRLAYGIQNITQMIKNALSIEKGTIIQHPEYGLGFRVGSSLADLDLDTIRNTAQGLFSDNEVFSGVQSVYAEQSGPYIKLTIVVGVKGLGSQIPITFNLSP